MKLVETLLVRDEADIVDAQIRHHLNAGVDFIIAGDHESQDGTTEILESYVRTGDLRRIPLRGEMHDGGWRTEMARLAASEHGADWVINTDADEFWTARGASLKDVFAAVPDPFGVVYALSRHFLPGPGEDGFFAERMVVRVSAAAAINDPTSPYRPHLKAAHRGDPDISVSHGAHDARSRRWRALPHWHACEVLHFPFRTLEQWENKGVRRARGDSQLGQYVIALRASEEGRSKEQFRRLLAGEAVIGRGLAEGSLQTDTRIRDEFRLAEDVARESQTPLDATLVAESAALREANLVRLQRQLDDVTERIAWHESRAGASSPSRARRAERRPAERRWLEPLMRRPALGSPVVLALASALAGIVAFVAMAALVEAFTDRDWQLSGMEWPTDFVTAALLVALVPLALGVLQLLLNTRREEGKRSSHLGRRRAGSTQARVAAKRRTWSSD